jgi:hypothetical protein
MIAAIAITLMTQNTFRPPALPLITHDPYLSIWSNTDHPADSWPTHWTGRPHAMSCLVRIDDEPFRLMGLEPQRTPKLPMKSYDFTPTSTTYIFEARGVEITMRFLSPLLPQRLDVLSRPASYIIWDARAIDAKMHKVNLHFDMTAEAAVDELSQEVIAEAFEADGFAGLSIGTVEQPILQKKGDNRRIDWGKLYVAMPNLGNSLIGVSTAEKERSLFVDKRNTTLLSKLQGVAGAPWPIAVLQTDFGNLSGNRARRYAVIAYDDIASIQYLGRNLQGFWRNESNAGVGLPAVAIDEFEALEKECAAFDKDLMSDLEKAGGKQYERIATLAYRSTIAGSKLVRDEKGNALFFPKENTSNGCIATVDVIYPMLPQLLLTDIELAKASLRPILEYADTLRWKFPFAPHDMGTYPHANGQVYGGGEKTEDNQMPVEESANMIIMLAAIAEIEGNAKFANEYKHLVTKWAEYLESKGYDPENQLSTDDFAGHLAHNVNLSAKAIIALACYAKLCDKWGDAAAAGKYKTLSKQFAERWVREATEGDHTLLAFDKPGTWSLKYNLVWDDILSLGLFPKEVKDREVAWYRKVSKKYGPPLDSRQDYTKLDWVLWVAAMASDQESFEALVEPVYNMLHETKTRVPMTDWYMVDSGDYRQFIARPVVGGVFIKMLKDRAMWAKWAKPR